MRVLILPAAGNGTRFAKEGFTNPKPFIDCIGVPMIKRAYQPFDKGVDRLVIISQEGHRKYWGDHGIGLHDTLPSSVLRQTSTSFLTSKKVQPSAFCPRSVK